MSSTGEGYWLRRYAGYLTFEYFHPYLHHPEAPIYQTADSHDRLLGIES